MKNLLSSDKRIRFIAKISYTGDFLDYAFRSDLDLEMKEIRKQKMGIHLSIMADCHRRIDKHCGKVSVTISLRPDLISLVYYTDLYLYCVSIDRCDDYPEIIKMISNYLQVHPILNV